MSGLIKFLNSYPRRLYAVVSLGLLLLPVALWLDLNTLSHHNLRAQAEGLSRMMEAIRAFHTDGASAGDRAGGDATQATLRYQAAGPSAAPVSPEAALRALNAQLSDSLPHARVRAIFENTDPEAAVVEMSAFERRAFDILHDPQHQSAQVIENSGDLFDQRLTLATRLHQSDGTRGVQIIELRQPLSLSLGSFKFLLTYLGVVSALTLVFARRQMQLVERFGRANRALSKRNSFLADVSRKVSKYLEPAVYRSISEGERGAEISTERKKLTVFFSDIKDFTATTERMQPEELTALLNEYFTEMGQIAEKHGATIDKFIGDAIVAFVGDPESKGAREDARAGLRMALEMQARLDELEQIWHARGVEHPFRARMGLNTGYCNVGNFGSETRMDYTIIGAEANLAARLESIADPGGIVMSYETYAHVKDLVTAEPLSAQRFKGISREIIPYRVLRHGPNAPMVAAQEDGSTLVVQMQGLDAQKREEIAAAVRAALKDI